MSMQHPQSLRSRRSFAAATSTAQESPLLSPLMQPRKLAASSHVSTVSRIPLPSLSIHPHHQDQQQMHINSRSAPTSPAHAFRPLASPLRAGPKHPALASATPLPRHASPSPSDLTTSSHDDGSGDDGQDNTVLPIASFHSSLPPPTAPAVGTAAAVTRQAAGAIATADFERWKRYQQGLLLLSPPPSSSPLCDSDAAAAADAASAMRAGDFGHAAKRPDVAHRRPAAAPVARKLTVTTNETLTPSPPRPSSLPRPQSLTCTPQQQRQPRSMPFGSSPAASPAPTPSPTPSPSSRPKPGPGSEARSATLHAGAKSDASVPALAAAAAYAINRPTSVGVRKELETGKELGGITTNTSLNVGPSDSPKATSIATPLQTSRDRAGALPVSKLTPVQAVSPIATSISISSKARSKLFWRSSSSTSPGTATSAQPSSTGASGNAATACPAGLTISSPTNFQHVQSGKAALDPVAAFSNALDLSGISPEGDKSIGVQLSPRPIPVPPFLKETATKSVPNTPLSLRARPLLALSAEPASASARHRLHIALGDRTHSNDTADATGSTATSTFAGWPRQDHDPESANAKGDMNLLQLDTVEASPIRLAGAATLARRAAVADAVLGSGGASGDPPVGIRQRQSSRELPLALAQLERERLQEIESVPVHMPNPASLTQPFGLKGHPERHQFLVEGVTESHRLASDGVQSADCRLTSSPPLRPDVFALLGPQLQRSKSESVSSSSQTPSPQASADRDSSSFFVPRSAGQRSPSNATPLALPARRSLDEKLQCAKNGIARRVNYARPFRKSNPPTEPDAQAQDALPAMTTPTRPLLPMRRSSSTGSIARRIAQRDHTPDQRPIASRRCAMPADTAASSHHRQVRSQSAINDLRPAALSCAAVATATPSSPMILPAVSTPPKAFAQHTSCASSSGENATPGSFDTPSTAPRALTASPSTAMSDTESPRTSMSMSPMQPLAGLASVGPRSIFAKALPKSKHAFYEDDALLPAPEQFTDADVDVFGKKAAPAAAARVYEQWHLPGTTHDRLPMATPSISDLHMPSYVSAASKKYVFIQAVPAHVQHNLDVGHRSSTQWPDVYELSSVASDDDARVLEGHLDGTEDGLGNVQVGDEPFSRTSASSDLLSRYLSLQSQASLPEESINGCTELSIDVQLLDVEGSFDPIAFKEGRLRLDVRWMVKLSGDGVVHQAQSFQGTTSLGCQRRVRTTSMVQGWPSSEAPIAPELKPRSLDDFKGTPHSRASSDARSSGLLSASLLPHTPRLPSTPPSGSTFSPRPFLLPCSAGTRKRQESALSSLPSVVDPTSTRPEGTPRQRQVSAGNSTFDARKMSPRRPPYKRSDTYHPSLIALPPHKQPHDPFSPMSSSPTRPLFDSISEHNTEHTPRNRFSRLDQPIMEVSPPAGLYSASTSLASITGSAMT
ncbi:hypothetical protein K437DRAFT_267759 [Tilletiaria anomala UBC 951]|uniref:Uncharacterized protein n=1 Tax=Tilletiaria anomala (strain ATCC 24038 / CBS 436.72 / UBC 951) TaxID=1037660 RepID=A0A066WB42_TILAU|nr:uncharacterized protein K437DRAFT_267759 [Tilletiaria anomala UBC 951]KDN47995.1 hypothetical protein K437DRAFT_267759 [Tilletiaria anomala UBC 951]